eukprot:TRINITY_DN121843_c0_g1_i1.p1 TRINITY_DN121843_c0_g1~~TRINITY_DN121843_c0_g1_i1.p1  ORF type:complete len:404 (-),score=75.63 TRINITY_DN121843_c0_g1_i1:217-1428(-)
MAVPVKASAFSCGACLAGLQRLVRRSSSRAAVHAEVEGLPAVDSYLNFGGGTHTKNEEGKELDIPQATPVKIYDGRADVARFKLHEHSFELVSIPDIGKKARKLDLYDPSVLMEQFAPLAEALALQRCPGATRAIAFDHIVRNPERLEAELAIAAKEREARAARQPVSGDENAQDRSSNQPKLETPSKEAPLSPQTPYLMGALANVHGDYTARSGSMRARQLLQPYATEAAIDTALANRVAIINVWYPFSTVRSDPLAMCTWSSMSPQDVCTNRMTFKHRVAETYKASWSERQRWVYFSEVTADEAVLLKTFDSLDDGTTARFSIHSAFKLPEQERRAAEGLPALPVRESVEVRLMVFWGEEQKSLAKDFIAPHMVPDSADNADELDGSGLLKKESIYFGDHW